MITKQVRAIIFSVCLLCRETFNYGMPLDPLSLLPEDQQPGGAHTIHPEVFRGGLDWPQGPASAWDAAFQAP